MSKSCTPYALGTLGASAHRVSITEAGDTYASYIFVILILGLRTGLSSLSSPYWAFGQDFDLCHPHIVIHRRSSGVRMRAEIMRERFSQCDFCVTRQYMLRQDRYLAEQAQLLG